jgi:phage-related protein
MAVFTLSPSWSPTSTRRPRVLATKFGDGYEQRATDGLHADLQSWSLTFAPIPVADADTIEAFFVANATAVTPFTWTAPRAAAASQFLCRSWTRTIVSPTTDSLTATFEEVADPA